MESDPFTQVFTALWELALSSEVLTSIIKPGNFIRFDSETDRDPLKNAITDGDLPELSLWGLGTASINLHSTSCTSQVKRQYTWMMATGDLRVGYRTLPVQWALLCAMNAYKSSLGALTWRGTRFVKKCEVVSLTESVFDTVQNRNVRGWSAVMGVEVDFVFATQQMIAYNNITSSSGS